MKKVINRLSTVPENIHPFWKNQFYLANKTGNFNNGVMKMTLFRNEDIASLDIPVLLICGDNDIFNDAASNYIAQECIPHVKIEVIKNAGHFVSFDQPELVNKVILEFLQSSKMHHRAGSY
jgi:pimeloyl-ACP methyl ester carboxylesterase